ncbi:MAG: hypothetical protein KIT87_21890, partial [Anaerolineae bacterium]|nr:hypothetical protein [Anaerolineae bacterium]
MLVDSSLLRLDEPPDGEARFWMLETIREYALERLAESGEADALKARHAAMFLALAEEAEPQLRGADGETWLKRLEAEHDNLRAVFEWTRETPGARGETALRLGCALWKFWHIRGHLSEGQRQLADVLTRLDTQAASQRRARALQGAGVMAYLQGGYAEARRLWEAGQAVCVALGDQRGSADAL